MNIEPNRLAVRRITDFAAVETLCRSILSPAVFRTQFHVQ